MHVPTSSSSLLTHSFYFWHMHAHSSHLFVYSCWIINFWAGCCDSNTHSHTHTLTRTWDWINTPLCSAEGGIDIIPGLKPNRLLSVRKREGGKDGGREEGARERGEKKGHCLLSGNMFALHCACSAFSYLYTLNFELHVILSGGLPIFPFLPAVAVLPVLHLLTVVEDHRAILRPDEDRVKG